MTLRHVTLGAGTSIGGSEPVISDAVTLGDVVYLSGRAPVDPATLRVLDGGFEVQARSVLADIDAVLGANQNIFIRRAQARENQFRKYRRGYFPDFRHLYFFLVFLWHICICSLFFISYLLREVKSHVNVRLFWVTLPSLFSRPLRLTICRK